MDHLGVNTGPEYTYHLIEPKRAPIRLSDQDEVLLASPALSGAVDPDDYRSEMILQALIGIFGQLRVQPTPDSWVLAYGLLIWQYEELLAELLPDSPAGIPGLGAWPPSPELVADIRLADLWHPAALSDADRQIAEFYLAELLVNYVVESQGGEAVTRIVRALEQANSMGGWIEIAASELPAEFEADWRDWMAARHGIDRNLD
jgi:hypothetical protein